MLVRINKEKNINPLKCKKKKKSIILYLVERFYSQGFNSRFTPFFSCYFCLETSFEVIRIFGSQQNMRSWKDTGQASTNPFQNGLAKRPRAPLLLFRLCLGTKSRKSPRAFFSTRAQYVIRLFILLLKQSHSCTDTVVQVLLLKRQFYFQVSRILAKIVWYGSSQNTDPVDPRFLCGLGRGFLF